MSDQETPQPFTAPPFDTAGLPPVDEADESTWRLWPEHLLPIEGEGGRYVSTAVAATHFQVSARTIRRRIQYGEIAAKRADRGHAWRVWIDETGEPSADDQHQNGDATEAEETTEEQGSGATGDTTPALVVATLDPDALYPLTDLIGDLTRQNAELSARLGAAQERIRQLEGQVQAIPAGESDPQADRPWWKRLFGFQ